MGFGSKDKPKQPTYREVVVKGDTQRPDPINQSANSVTRQQNPSLIPTSTQPATRTG